MNGISLVCHYSLVFYSGQLQWRRGRECNGINESWIFSKPTLKDRLSSAKVQKMSLNQNVFSLYMASVPRYISLTKNRTCFRVTSRQVNILWMAPQKMNGCTNYL